MNEPGYGYTSEGLWQTSGNLSGAASWLETAGNAPAEAPDAGISSGQVAIGMAEVMALATGASVTLNDIADKVHATEGSYDTIENTNKGQFDLKEQTRQQDWEQHYQSHPPPQDDVPPDNTPDGN